MTKKFGQVSLFLLISLLSILQTKQDVVLFGQSFDPSSTTSIDLSLSSLSGVIPPQVGGLSLLQSLILYNNTLGGSIPSEIGELTALTHLELDFNQLSGTLPTQLGRLTNLVVLTVTNNELSGTVPSEIGLLTLAQTFGFDSNHFSGYLPSTLGLLVNEPFSIDGSAVLIELNDFSTGVCAAIKRCPNVDISETVCDKCKRGPGGPGKPEDKTPTQTRTSSKSISVSKTVTPSNSQTPSNSPSNTQTPSNSPSNTQTPSNSPSNTQTPTNTATSSLTSTPSKTATTTATSTKTATKTSSPSKTATKTSSSTQTATQTATNSRTSSQSPSQTASSSQSPTQTASSSSSPTQTASSSQSPTQTASSSSSPTSSASQTPTSSASGTSTASSSQTPSSSASGTSSQTGTASTSQTPSSSASGTSSQTGTASTSQTPSSSASGTSSQTGTASTSQTATSSVSGTSSQTGTASTSQTATSSVSETATSSASASVTTSSSSTASVSASSSSTASVSASSSSTASVSASSSSTASVSASSSSTASVTASSSSSASVTASSSSTASVTASASPSTPPTYNIVTVQFVLTYTGDSALTSAQLNSLLSQSVQGSFNIPANSIILTQSTDSGMGMGMGSDMDANMVAASPSSSPTRVSPSSSPSLASPSSSPAQGMGMAMGKKSSASIKATFVVTFSVTFPYVASTDLNSLIQGAIADVQSSFNFSGYIFVSLVSSAGSPTACSSIKAQLSSSCLPRRASTKECSQLLQHSICLHGVAGAKSMKATCSVDISDVYQVDDYYYEQCSSDKTLVCPCQNGGYCNRTGSCQCVGSYGGETCSVLNSVSVVVDVDYTTSKSCNSISSADYSSMVSKISQDTQVSESSILVDGCVQNSKSVKQSTQGSVISFQIIISNSTVNATQVALAAQSITSFPALGITVIRSTTGSTSNVVVAYDCTGSPYGRAVIDLCGVCGGSNDCIDCTGQIGNIRTDVCGVCGGLARSTSECISPDGGNCVDNTSFVDETGLKCENWANAECVTASSDWQYSENGLKNLLRNCPHSCRQCRDPTGKCIDNVNFVDEGGLSCSAWIGSDCSTADVMWGYSSRGVESLIKNCKYSCRKCDSESTTGGSSSSSSSSEGSTISSTIIGGVVGGVCAAALGLTILFCCRRTKSKRSQVPKTKATSLEETVL